MSIINNLQYLEKLTNLERRAHKLNDIFNVDLFYHFEVLFHKKENEWFKADNKAHFQTYDVCNKLFEMNLICKKIEPIYRNGSYCGNNVYFKYNKELKYNYRKFCQFKIND